MGDNEASNDTVDRALRLLVYGPVGLACYLKDSAPTFMDLFVSRGKREVDGARRVVEEKLGFAKPEPEPTSPQQRVADSLGSLSKVAAQATSMMASMAQPVVNAATNAASTVVSPRPDSGTEAPSAPASPDPAPAPAAAPAPAPAATNGAGNGAERPASGTATDLPIPGYDGLSASQVIERLEGMSRGALERVRLYELAHRARRTILASIDQLTS